MTSPKQKIEHDEIEDFEDSDKTSDPNDETEVYESGKLKSVRIDELKNNVVAIKQLINNFNSLQKRTKILNEQLTSKTSEIEYLKTTPFIAISATISNVLFVIINGVGINMLTSSESSKAIGWTLLIVGGLGILCSNLWPILYPYARKFFNKK